MTDPNFFKFIEGDNNDTALEWMEPEQAYCQENIGGRIITRLGLRDLSGLLPARTGYGFIETLNELSLDGQAERRENTERFKHSKPKSWRQNYRVGMGRYLRQTDRFLAFSTTVHKTRREKEEGSFLDLEDLSLDKRLKYFTGEYDDILRHPEAHPEIPNLQDELGYLDFIANMHLMQSDACQDGPASAMMWTTTNFVLDAMQETARDIELILLVTTPDGSLNCLQDVPTYIKTRVPGPQPARGGAAVFNLMQWAALYYSEDDRPEPMVTDIVEARDIIDQVVELWPQLA